jgi:hypothetical protein
VIFIVDVIVAAIGCARVLWLLDNGKDGMGWEGKPDTAFSKPSVIGKFFNI